MDGFSDVVGMVVGPVSLVLLGLLLVLLGTAYRTPTWDADLRQAIVDELDLRGWWAGHLEASDSRVAHIAQLCGGEVPDDTHRARAAGELARRGAHIDAAELARRQDDASALALARFSTRSRRIGDLDMLLRAWPYLRTITQGELAWVALRDLGRPVVASLAGRFARHLGHLSAAAGVLAVLVWPWVQNVGGSAVPRWQEFVGALVNLAVGASMLWTLTTEVRTIAAPTGPTVSRRTVAAAWLMMLGIPVLVATGTAERSLLAVNTYLADQVARLDAQAHVALGGATFSAVCLYGAWWHLRSALVRRGLLRRVESVALAVCGASLTVALLAVTLGWSRPFVLGGIATFMASAVAVGVTELLSRIRELRRAWRAIRESGHPHRPATWQVVVWASTALSVAAMVLTTATSSVATGAWATIATAVALLSIPFVVLLVPLTIVSAVAAALFARSTRLTYEALVSGALTVARLEQRRAAPY